MNNNPIDVSIIIVTYNSQEYIDDCLNSIYNQNQDNYTFEIIVVDNSSTDNTVKYLKSNFPNVRIFENNLNVGYGRANNLGAQYSNGEYIVILNPDTSVEQMWLENLIKPLINSKKVIVTPKVLKEDELINSCGLIAHFTGLGFTRGLNLIKDDFENPEDINGIFGCCFAMRKNDFHFLGGFDENIFLYGEDTELSWRAHLKGFRIIFNPYSTIKHDYILNVPPKKIYYLEKSRYIILRKYFSKFDFLYLLPSILLAEILTWAYAAKFGKEGIYYKSISIKDALKIELIKEDGEKNDLFRSLEPKIPTDQLTYSQFQKFIKEIFNKIFYVNWKLYLFIKN